MSPGNEMKNYDPEHAPQSEAWLALEEAERIEIVTAFHRRSAHAFPNVRLHATFHVIVENQLALGVPAVIETLARLRQEGLTRHDALHAIGSVLAAGIFDTLKGPPRPEHEDPNVRYAEQLKVLTATKWNAG
jgi:hypothetical protein